MTALTKKFTCPGCKATTSANVPTQHGYSVSDVKEQTGWICVPISDGIRWLCPPCAEKAFQLAYELEQLIGSADFSVYALARLYPHPV